MLINNENKGVVSPNRFIIDFELALVKAAKKLFKCLVNGCYFHFTQSMWRNVSSKGLIPLFTENKSELHIVELKHYRSFV